MEQETEKKETKVLDKLKEETDKSMKRVLEQGVQTNNVEFLCKMIDIKKDIAEIEKEEQEMMYSNYGNYGRENDMMYSGGRSRDSRGRYMESGSYGRRGVKGTGRGRYRGEEMMDEIAYHYGNYNEGREKYGADEETLKSFEYMLKSFKDYYKHLKQEASSPQEVKMLEQTAEEMLEM
jgi:hypothetical protein